MSLAFPDDFDVSRVQMIKKRQFFLSFQNNSLLCLIIGIVGGFVIGRINQFLVARQNLWCVSSLEMDVLRIRDKDHESIFIQAASGTTDENLVLIGVMTAKKYLDSRVLAVRNTWANDSSLRIIFFTSEGSEVFAPDGVEVVGLRGVDDSYPPQKKSFLMLKYMHDNYRNRYRFFMRADDDVYIKTDKLASFLHSIDTSNNRALFIGQAGLGNKNEFGTLDLRADENFCMGGPAMILSRETLVRVVPHIAECLKNLYTTHEDVEVGRCVSRYAKISCTWSYEMQKLFYNNYNEPHGSFIHSLKDPAVQHAITLHPFKNVSYMYRAHHHFLSKRAADVRNKRVEVIRNINRMNIELQDRDEYYSPDKFGLEPSLMKFIPRTGEEVMSWDFLSKHIYSDKHSNPRRLFETDLQSAIDDIIVQLMENTNEDAHQKGRLMDFKELLYGYRRVVAPYSADYIFDLLLTYKKFKSKQKMAVPVRRHVYVQQSFLHPEFLIDSRLEHQDSSKEPQFEMPKKDDDIYGPSSALPLPDLSSKMVNVILPLAGRHNVFLKFMKNFEEVCLKTDENVSLHVVLFKGDDQNSNHLETTSFLEVMALKYPRRPLTYQILEGPFSRGIALQKGANHFQADDLLFFIDVDIAMQRDVLLRTRLNTVSGQQVYYPIVFSQYNPRYVCNSIWKHKSQTEVFFPDMQRMDKNSVWNADSLHTDSNDLYVRKFNDKDNFHGDILDGHHDHSFSSSNTNLFHDNTMSHQGTRVKRSVHITSDGDGDSIANEMASAVSQQFNSLFLSLIGACEKGYKDNGTFNLQPEAGYWREFGFGIAAMYKNDFDAVGGFDLDIKGWGKEDVDLVERFISSDYYVFRSVDPGLVHVYHPIVCSPHLDPAQYQMCLGSKASSYASIDTLARLVLGIPEIIKKDEFIAKTYVVP